MVPAFLLLPVAVPTSLRNVLKNISPAFFEYGLHRAIELFMYCTVNFLHMIIFATEVTSYL